MLMISNLLALTERRFDRTLQEQSQLSSIIKQQKQQCMDIRQRISVLATQTASYEKSEELSRNAFWERQRLKAAVLAEIAQFEFQIETLIVEISKNKTRQSEVAKRVFVLRNKCEKFRNYLKQQRIERRLKSELQQQNEIEELFVHVSNKSEFK
ncbi:hypothetical protein AB6F64_00870 [Providencia hangzhouensis]|nr:MULTISPECIES: hypothetical protein [Providencia]MCB6145938.1 hypothetical protein [Providencia rettgeri]MDB9567986.1 hypothetical protein [Providencia rettgeri]UDQ67504.1 hypothetical protein LHK11_00880 [Providencia rettgeri]WOB91161.1 hypothetical protein P3L44_00855 [Providencia sp. PROV175]WOB99889.1 hypothetical protein P3L55_00790 [Providencia sp. PROV046]